MFEDLSSSRAQNLNLLQIIQKKGILASRHQLTPENMPRASQFSVQHGFSNATWKLRALRIVYFLLRQNTENIKFKLIDRKIFSIIHDQSSEYEYYRNNGYLYTKPTIIERALYKIKHIIPKLILEKIANDQNVIFPDSYLKLFCDIVLTIVILLNLFYIPFSVCFNLESSGPLQFMFLVLPIMTFIFEIILNFNTAYYKEGLIHTRRNSIAKNYLKTGFFLDLLVIIFYIISSIANEPVILFVLFLRFPKLNQVIKNLEEVLNLREKWAFQIDLIKLITLVLFVSHFCACAWFLVGKTEMEYGKHSWIIYYNAQNESNSVQYVYSLYWSTITLLTVGYGDLTPQTYSERIFCIFTSTIAIGIFGYAINSIGSIFKELDDKNRKFSDALQSINYYLNTMNLDKSLVLKVRRYFEHIYVQRENDDSSISQQLLKEMTPDLKQEVQVALYKKIILRSKFLQQNLSEDCLIDLCGIVQDKKLHPNEILFEKDKLSKQIYFIRQGEIQIYYERKYYMTGKIREKTVKKIKSNGHVLSEKQFLLNQAYEYSAKTVKFTHVSYIEYSQFIQVLKNHPEDYQKYCMMKDNLLYNANYKAVKTVCEICGYLHILSQCPFPFYQINKNKLIRQLTTSETQQRQPNNRKDRLKYELSTIQNSALAYGIDNQLQEVELIDEDHLKNLGFLKENQDLFVQLEEKDQEDLDYYYYDEPDAKPKNFIQRMSLKIYNSDNWGPLDKINTGIQEPQQLYGVMKQTSPVTPKLPDITPLTIDNDLQISEVLDFNKENSKIQLFEPLQSNLVSKSISKQFSVNQSQSLKENKTLQKKFERKVKIDNPAKVQGRQSTVILEGCKFRFLPCKLPNVQNSFDDDTSSYKVKPTKKQQLIVEQPTNRLDSSIEWKEQNNYSQISKISKVSENFKSKTIKFADELEVQNFEIDQQKYFKFFFPNMNYEDVIHRFEYQRRYRKGWQSKKNLFKSAKIQTIFNFSKKKKK